MAFPIERNITLAFPYFMGHIYNGGENLLSEALADLEKIRPEDLDKEILRAAMIAELLSIFMSRWQTWQKAKRYAKSCLMLPEKKKST